MPQLEIIVGLLVAVAALATLAARIKVPYPILLVLGGLVLGFVPGLPPFELEPDMVFLIFLPPLLYVSAIFTSWRDFRANLRPISLLSVGLVIFTTCAVAAVAHATIEGLTWPAAFVLGAIVSPTDAIAATSVAQRIAVAAVMAGVFSIWEAGFAFVVGSIGGVLFGLAMGWIVVWGRRHASQDPPVQNTISLLTPFAAYL